jgi:uncharacterized membrane protein
MPERPATSRRPTGIDEALNADSVNQAEPANGDADLPNADLANSATDPQYADSDRPGNAVSSEETLPDLLAVPRRTWSPLDLVLSGFVAIAVGTLAWFWRSELTPSDPWHYVMAALEFPQDTWVPLGYTRYGLILPLGPLVVAWGHAPATFLVPALVASALMCACVFLVATRWWGRVAGFVAVALLVTNWIVFVNLTRYYPDIPSMALVLLALVLAIVARDRQRSTKASATWLVLLVGFLLGWSFEARETALFSWPIVIWVLWVSGRVRKNATLVALPVLLWAAADVVISAVAYGDPLLKLHTFTRQDLSATKLPGDIAVMDRFVGLPRLDYLTMIPRLALESGVPGGRWFLGLGAAALVGLFVRNRAVRASSAALAISYLMFVGISGFFLPDHPAGRLDVQRYWIQFVPWISLSVAGLTYVVVRRVFASRGTWVRRTAHIVAGAALVVGPALVVSTAASESAGLAPNGGAPLKEVSAALAHLPTAGAHVYTDWETMRVLPIYQRPFFGGERAWTAPVRSITGGKKPTKGDYVLLVRATDTPCYFCTVAVAPWRARHHSVPANWHKVLVTPREGYVLYAVR